MISFSSLADSLLWVKSLALGMCDIMLLQVDFSCVSRLWCHSECRSMESTEAAHTMTVKYSHIIVKLSVPYREISEFCRPM